ncbi:hypothetical protein [Streptosporangium sp. KLBMP 9127]|nr:hypothetical protein [Streptosporangium sp. KLBMP 9127]
MEHPAFARRIVTARETGRVPGLIVTGGDRNDRDLVAAAYATSLVTAGLVDESVVYCAAESRLGNPGRLADEGARPYQNDLLIVTEVGARAALGLPEPPHGDPETFGYASLQLDRLMCRRHHHRRPVVLTSPLAPGNREAAAGPLAHGHGTGVIMVSGPNLGLLTTLDERAQAGWTLPSGLGFDPDSHIVSAVAPPTMQEYLGGRIWWRLYKNAYGAAVDARALARQLGLS